ncbi:MAG: LamG domain-containing protein [Patulibacter minatonensis]
MQSVSDPAGIASVTADLTGIENANNAPLFTAGGPWSGYAYRTAARTADVPLETGSTSAWAVRATNTTGDASTLSGLTYNVRSYVGLMRGEFGAAATASLSQYYRFSDSANAGTNQGSGGTANVTYNGAPNKQVPGALVGATDTAVELNGDPDYLSSTRLATLTGDLSAEIWVKGSGASGSGPGTAFSDSAGLVDAGNAASTRDWGVAVDASGRIVAGCGNGATVHSASNAIADGAWHHIVFTRTRTSGATALYVDGQPVAAATGCTTQTLTGGTTVWYGRSHESNLYFQGTLDEVGLYARVLTPAEVLDHYRLGTGTG